MNTSVHSSTGVAPADVVFPNGRQLDHQLVSTDNPIYMSDYIREMQQAQASIIAVCEQSLRNKDAAHMANSSNQATTYASGSYVLAEHRLNSLRRGPKSKFLPFLRGPMLVKSHDQLDMYTLQDLVTQRLAKYHVSKLQPYEYDARTLDPLTVAVTDMPEECLPQECLGPENPRRTCGSEFAGQDLVQKTIRTSLGQTSKTQT